MPNIFTEEENARLKKVLAEIMPDKEVLNTVVY